MDAPRCDLSSLVGKRVLLIEDDDRLFYALRGALLVAGCEVVGGAFSEVPSLIPIGHADIAIVDGGPHSSSFVMLAQRLAQHRIPTIFIGTDLPPALLPGCVRLMKPFTEQALLESLVAAASARAIAASANTAATA
jgi:hypothetical protein